MTTTLYDDGTAALDLPGVDTQQWTMTSFSVVNWGNHPYTTVHCTADPTALVGGSGSGKSTLLDGYIALTMDSRARFNVASNDGGGKESRRSLLSYTRGRGDDTTDPLTGEARPTYMRGTDKPSWSAIVANFTDGYNDISATMLIHVPRGAANNGELSRTWIIADEHVNDPLVFTPTRPGRFTRERIEQIMPRSRVFVDRPRDYLQTLYSVLGIGNDFVQGQKAMQLALNIQQGVPVESINDLFRTLVMEEPKTFEVAASVVGTYEQLRDSYEVVADAERRQQTLAPLRDMYDRYTSTSAEIDAAETLNPCSRTGKWAQWISEQERTLRTEYRTVLESELKQGRDDLSQREQAYEKLDSDLEAINADYYRRGGDRLASLDQKITAMREKKAVVVSARQFVQRTLTDPLPETAEQFEQVLRDLPDEHTVEQNVSEAKKVASEASAAVTRLDAAIVDLSAEITSLSSRSGNISRELDEARTRMARAAGQGRENVPFVAELIDIKPEYEPWREAIELALGGFAVTMLVEHGSEGQTYRQFRSAINDTTAARRVKNESVDLDMPVPVCEDTSRLSGRIVVNGEHPFAGWVMQRIVDRFDYVCVDDPSELSDHAKSLTITGQTNDGGRRGAHGGHGKRSMIGFDNTAAIRSLEHRLAETTAQHAAAVEKRDAVFMQVDEANKRKADRMTLMELDWSTVDVHGLTVALGEIESERKTVAEDDGLSQLDEQRAAAKRARDNAATQLSLAESDVQRTEDAITRNGTELDRIADLIGDGRADLTDQQRAVCERARRDARAPSLKGDEWPRWVAFHQGKVQSLVGDLAARRDEHAEAMCRTMETYLRNPKWKDERPELQPTVQDYPEFEAILSNIEKAELPRAKGSLRTALSNWSTEGLSRLRITISQEKSAIKNRLDSINEVLRSLPFGHTRGSLQIEPLDHQRKHVIDFLRLVATLAETYTASRIAASDTEDTVAQTSDLINHMEEVIDQIRGGHNEARARQLLDVRQHLTVRAQVHDPDGTVRVLERLGMKSGGESQEIAAFVIAAALRFRLGDGTATRPRYAPVFLDEGFVKADTAHSNRALQAWRTFGFQLIIGAPDNGFERFNDQVRRTYWTAKDDETGYAGVSLIEREERELRWGSGAQ